MHTLDNIGYLGSFLFYKSETSSGLFRPSKIIRKKFYFPSYTLLYIYIYIYIYTHSGNGCAFEFSLPK